MTAVMSLKDNSGLIRGTPNDHWLPIPPENWRKLVEAHGSDQAAYEFLKAQFGKDFAILTADGEIIDI